MNVQEFFSANNGRGLDFDGWYGDQCVDLAQFYNRDVVGAPPLTGNAADIWYSYPRACYSQIVNTATNAPELGDIVIWSGALNGGPGHIAVCQSGDANGFTSFDQNWPEGSICHFQGHDYSYVLGWLHPHLSVVPVPVPTQPAPRRTTVIAQCGLKPAAAHGGPDLATIPAGGQVVVSGVSTGPWRATQWRDLHGYVLAANVR